MRHDGHLLPLQLVDDGRDGTNQVHLSWSLEFKITNSLIFFSRLFYICEYTTEESKATISEVDPDTLCMKNNVSNICYQVKDVVRLGPVDWSQRGRQIWDVQRRGDGAEAAIHGGQRASKDCHNSVEENYDFSVKFI